MKNSHKIIIIALIDAFLSQFYFLLSPYQFPISLGVAVLPIYYYYDESLNPIKTGITIMSIGVFYRTITEFYSYGNVIDSFMHNITYIFFDLCYAFIFYLCFYVKEKKSIYIWFIVGISADFVSNLADFMTRYGKIGLLKSNVVVQLLVIAVLRMGIAGLIILCVKKYDESIKRREKYKRYQEILSVNSDLKGEVYFMKKNMEHIESVMDEAYSLYKLYDDYSDKERKERALHIATDVHEIKKNYYRVIEGINEITDIENFESSLKINEMMEILYDTLSKSNMMHMKKINLSVYGDEKIYVKEHYLLMSVLRNLINNSIEAIPKEKVDGQILVNYAIIKNHLMISVKDNGKGIKDNLQSVIFNPGFSTKFDEDTGDANRGLGLSLVKEIIDEKFKGNILLESKHNHYTQFTIKIPIINL